jgi:hypothetical protein
MWHNGKKVTRTFTTNNSQNCWAIISTISGWKKVKTGNTDGVSNVFTLLASANASNRTVDVFINNNVIEQVVMR